MSTAVILEKTNPLYNKVRKLICEIYTCIFKGRLEIYKTNFGYCLLFGIPSNTEFSTIYVEGNEKQFLNILKQELKNSRYGYVEYKEALLTNER